MIDEIYNLRESQLPAAERSEEYEDLCAEFETTLNDEQLELFRRLSDPQSTSAVEETRAEYKVGFKDGVSPEKKFRSKFHIYGKAFYPYRYNAFAI